MARFFEAVAHGPGFSPAPPLNLGRVTSHVHLPTAHPRLVPGPPAPPPSTSSLPAASSSHGQCMATSSLAGCPAPAHPRAVPPSATLTTAHPDARGGPLSPQHSGLAETSGQALPGAGQQTPRGGSSGFPTWPLVIILLVVWAQSDLDMTVSVFGPLESTVPFPPAWRCRVGSRGSSGGVLGPALRPSYGRQPAFPLPLPTRREGGSRRSGC